MFKGVIKILNINNINLKKDLITIEYKHEGFHSHF